MTDHEADICNCRQCTADYLYARISPFRHEDIAAPSVQLHEDIKDLITAMDSQYSGEHIRAVLKRLRAFVEGQEGQ